MQCQKIFKPDQAKCDKKGEGIEPVKRSDT
jgi:hypothetical protein